MADLALELAGLRLVNPILSASGTFGHGLEMGGIVSPRLIGGWVSKTVTLRPRPGNPMPRIAETEAGFLNSIGLENRGIDHYEAEILPTLAGVETCIVTNIGGERDGEFAELAARLDGRDEIDAFEINLSCPNVDGGRLPYATDPAVAERIVRSVREATTKPIFAKLSPNVTRIEDIAVACEAGGADGLTAVNTVLGMKLDWRTGRPALNTTVGGYSGVAIKPIALRCAWAAARSVRIPVIGCGGIRGPEDVLEFLAAGCHAVQVGTANFSDPGGLARLASEVAALLDDAGLATVHEVIGLEGRRAQRVARA